MYEILPLGRVISLYVCIFVCFSTKAVHLEATSDLSTDAFLAAFQRFVSRRGCPHTIFSDNGTNFLGASREIERDFRIFLNKVKLECVLHLRFKVLRGDSFQQELLIWEVFGKPLLKVSNCILGKNLNQSNIHLKSFPLFTFEELTIMARIEACLNSRPLCPISDNPSEPVALTPGHFLIGSPILAPPEPSIFESPIGLINRYRKVKAFTQEFCRRWKDEYLTNLHKRYKWKFPERDVSVNDLVVIRHEQLSPTSRKLGRVVKTYPGSDGHVRDADILTETGVLKRPITKLVVIIPGSDGHVRDADILTETGVLKRPITKLVVIIS